MREVFRVLDKPIRLQLSSALMDKPTTKRTSCRGITVHGVKAVSGNRFGNLADVIDPVDNQVLKFWDEELVCQNPELDQGEVFVVFWLSG